MSGTRRQPRIIVTVVYDARSPRCEARCGLDLSSPEIFKSTVAVLRQLFGSEVKLECVGLDAVKAGPLAAIGERLKTGELVLPLLLINGKPRISGYFDLHSLQEVIRTEIEMAAS
ncbi:MAG: hypothetical protein QUS33_03780 [Dehalococcoidia bacterium]|nr:hypothetical protein [Dehalococcoidia bacterium]